MTTDYCCTFRSPSTGTLIVDTVQAQTADGAMTAIWEKYGEVGSLMVRPRGVPMFPRDKNRRKYDPTAAV